MRPLSQGTSAIRRDVRYLLRCLYRVQQDPKRYAKERTVREIAWCLKKAIVLLVEGERQIHVVNHAALGLEKAKLDQLRGELDDDDPLGTIRKELIEGREKMRHVAEEKRRKKRLRELRNEKKNGSGSSSKNGGSRRQRMEA